MPSASKGITVVAAALIAALPAWAVEPARYSPDAGPHKVLTVDQLILHDSARHKDVRVKIYYPDGPGAVSRHRLLPRRIRFARSLLGAGRVLGQLRLCEHSSFAR